MATKTAYYIRHTAPSKRFNGAIYRVEPPVETTDFSGRRTVVTEFVYVYMNSWGFFKVMPCDADGNILGFSLAWESYLDRTFGKNALSAKHALHLCGYQVFRADNFRRPQIKE